ncbi:Txe/YoeB family addiction module toxin [Bacteroidia bacterium]|nr:Txe/YoeB family addiction module toxin [Bacteroidia bacterium]
MEIRYSSEAENDLAIIKKNGTPVTKKRLERILKDILEHPYTGFASPEELKHNLSGKWSRELSKKDRVIYNIEDDALQIYSLLGHYADK